MLPMLAVVGIAACADIDHIGPAHYSTLYSTGLVAYAVPKGEMTTEIRGDAPGGPEAVAAMLRPPGWLPPFRFATKPMPGTPSNYRVVLHFDPAAAAVGGESVCRGERSPDITPPPERTRVQAVFCVDDRLVSEANGYTARARSPAEPAFRGTLDHLMAALMPTRNPNFSRDDPRCGFRPC
jgi:hypothetical protein